MGPQLQERLVIYGGFLPGAVSLILLMAAWYFHAFKKSRVDHAESNEEEQPRRSGGPRWLLPIMLAMGFVGAVYASDSTFKLWPDSNNDRYMHAIALIALVGVLEGLVRLPVLVGFAFRFVGFGGVFWMLAEGYPGVFGNTQTFVGSAIFAALASSLIATASDRNSEDTPAWVDAITWIVIAGAAMPIFLFNSFSTGAMIPAGIIAVLVAAMLTSFVFRDLRIARGGVTVLVGFMLTMLTGSIIQTGATNLPAVLLVAASPMVTLVPLRSVSGLRRLLARLVLLAMVLGASGGLVYATKLADKKAEQGAGQDDGGYPMDDGGDLGYEQ